MIKLEMDTSSLADLQQRLTELGPQFASQVQQALTPLLYQSLRTGVQKYFSGGSGPSGTFLTSRSGRLLNSVLDSLSVSTDGAQLKVSIGSDVPYAAIHEYGGYAGRRPPYKKKDGRRPYIPARPYLRPTLDDLQQVLPSLVDQAIQQVQAAQ